MAKIGYVWLPSSSYQPGCGMVGHLIEERVSRTKTVAVGRVTAATVGTGVVVGGGVVGQSGAVSAGHGLVPEL